MAGSLPEQTIQKGKAGSADGSSAPLETSDAYYAGASETAAPTLLADTASYTVREKLTPDASGIVLVMVGLPARGKSFISRKVERFLQWRGMPTRSFNVGKYRRNAVAPTCSGHSDFFDAANKTAMQAREQAALSALQDAFAFLNSGGKVSILDATNSTVQRRQLVAKHVAEHSGNYAVLYVEAICDDEQVLRANMQGKVKNSPDFAHLSVEAALEDLKSRIRKYEDVYETVQDHEGAYIKLFNLSSKVMANHCYGRIAKSVLPYLMAIHIGSRPIWLTRTGSVAVSEAGVDRASPLSAEGRAFASRLAYFVRRRTDEFYATVGKSHGPMHVFTSTMPRAVASVNGLEHEQTSALNPIDKGTIGKGWWDVQCDSDLPPWDELQSRHPDFAEQWRRDPVRCRFPGGESYQDIVNRLEGLLIEVEMCTRPVLIVSHITVLQLLLAYFYGRPMESAVDLRFPKGSVLEVKPTSGGSFVCEMHSLCDIDAKCTADKANFSSVSDIRHSGAESTAEYALATKRQRVC